MDLQNPIFFEASQVSSTNPNWHFVCPSVNPTGTQIRPCPQLFWACIRIPFPTSECVFLLKRGAFFVDPKRLPMSRNIQAAVEKGNPAVWEGRFEVKQTRDGKRWVMGNRDIRISRLVDRNPNCQAPTVEDSSSPATKRLKTEVPGPVTFLWRLLGVVE